MLLLLLTAATAASPELVSGLHPGSAQAPAWSGDGLALTYEVSLPESRTVSLYRVAPGARPELVVRQDRSSGSSGGFQRRVRAHVAHEVAWAPAGTNAFVFAHGREGGDLDLVLDSGGSLAPAAGADGGPAWSADGRWIVFTSARSGQGDLYRVDLDDPELPPVRLTRDPDASELYAAIAPDSRRVAFTAHTPRGDNLLLIDDLTQPSAPTVLTPWPGAQVRPTWSPDGRRIAFYGSAPGDDRWDLMVLEPGGTARRLAAGVVPGRHGPAWIPDGRALVFVHDDDDRFDPLYRVAVDGTGTATLVPTGTVGNRDPAVVLRGDGTTWLAVSAQGAEGDTDRDFHRIYIQRLD